MIRQDKTIPRPMWRYYPPNQRLSFALYVRNDNRRLKLVTLIAICGALDMDDPQPAITIMLPDED